ncbi:hypothetical protein B0181_07735 [Moraxella caviae]|uniref:Ribosomal RNA small subunit methyltransferase J n=1 Tax=Moraxella caviae TaxID=34060 RepID=A0A1S9ZZB8_9GAMM|nr:class I SAM-dependent methyltransferase [Moraxella caviae]OOR88778.1 hypothetical protein B0181_07735 [Moraxella caviae]STZ14870.1 Ribosomal RNA small subunit methyltransferase J [Moraxella caviae]VEW13664.1 Ribosomal RNA small subunit methyltransferase J [Moraxella caviae]
MKVFVIGTKDDTPVFQALQAINDEQGLGLDLSFTELAKMSDKYISYFYQDRISQNDDSQNDDSQTPIIAIIKGAPTLIQMDNHAIIKSHLNWQSLTQRIVSAGRKSELVLQACKLTAQMSVIDGTAGFGHDGLILASSGASVLMVEQNPVMALLLHHEHAKMHANPNWHKLLQRITIRHQNFLCAEFTQTLHKADVVYLDPMFPSESYSAKVGKNMQILHKLAAPPSADDEAQFFKMAQNCLAQGGKIVVKRPLSAPFLAQRTPSQSIANDAIRFDRYDG